MSFNSDGTKPIEQVNASNDGRQATTTDDKPATAQGVVVATEEEEEVQQRNERPAKTRDGTSTISREFGQSEHNIVAKQQGKPCHHASQHGAVAEGRTVETTTTARQQHKSSLVSASPDARAELRTMEDAVLAKVRGSKCASSSSDSHRVTELSNMESAVLAKVRNNNNTNVDTSSSTGTLKVLSDMEEGVASGGAGGGQRPCARAELGDMETAALTKVRSENNNNKTTSIGALAVLGDMEEAVFAKARSKRTEGGFAELSSIEAAVLAKCRREQRTSTITTRSKLSDMEAAVLAKAQHTHPSAHAELHTYEAAITSTKTAGSSTAPREVAENNIESIDDMLDDDDESDIANAELDTYEVAVTNTKTAGCSTVHRKVAKNNIESMLDDDVSDKIVEHTETETEAATELDIPTEAHYDHHGEHGRGLVVARPINEEEENQHLPLAVEFDPDIKRLRLDETNGFRLYTFIASFVLILAIVGAAIGITVSNKRDDGNATTFASTSFRESLGIQELIGHLVGSEELEDRNSPYSKALDWIIFEDPQQLTLDDNNLVQRYTTAYFYFATAVNKPWLCCNPPVGNETDTCIFQRMIHTNPDEYDKSLSTRWLSNSTECSWAGIVCDDFDQIRSVELRGLNLNGDFPEGVIHWTYLQSLELSFNGLSGSLPPGLGSSMKNLLSIGLNANLFSGEIPSDWWMASNLQRLNLGENRLVGTIPPEIAGLKRIKGLFLYGNKLDGSIPDELGDLSQLLHLRLQRNMISGSIPSSIGRLDQMNSLWLFTNALTGHLPTEVGNLSTIYDFRVHTNHLTGELPLEFYDTTTAIRIELFDCNFTGPILSAIGNFTSMTTLDINGNNFSGQLPAELGLLSNIIHLRLDDNDFVGSVPAELCAWRDPEYFKWLEADCLVDPVTGVAELACPEGCCTICCDASGQECVVQKES